MEAFRIARIICNNRDSEDADTALDVLKYHVSEWIYREAVETFAAMARIDREDLGDFLYCRM